MAPASPLLALGRAILEGERNGLDHAPGKRWVGADTRNAVELRETGYPDRQYLPRDDVAMQRLVRTDTVTHCPFKGDASYYAIELVGGSLPDAAWSYEAPFEAMADIAERLAFDTRLVEEKVEEKGG